jgi:hypothetical protein
VLDCNGYTCRQLLRAIGKNASYTYSDYGYWIPVTKREITRGNVGNQAIFEELPKSVASGGYNRGNRPKFRVVDLRVIPCSSQAGRGALASTKSVARKYGSTPYGRGTLKHGPQPVSACA